MGFRFAGANFSVIAIDNTPAIADACPQRLIAEQPQRCFRSLRLVGMGQPAHAAQRNTRRHQRRVDDRSRRQSMSVTLNNVTSSTFRYSILRGTLLLAPRELKRTICPLIIQILLRRRAPFPRACDASPFRIELSTSDITFSFNVAAWCYHDNF